MINIVNKDLFDSNANFVVHQVNCMGVMGSGVAAQVKEMFPHVEREYKRYLKHYDKIEADPIGTVQYTPTEVWAIGMVDTIKNDNVIAYDNNYQYIVNLFGQRDYGMGEQYTNLEAFKKAFTDICYKARKIKATIAVPYLIGSRRGGASWNDVYKIIEEAANRFNVDIEICKLDRG